MTLSFDNNWRRTFLLTQDEDLDREADYIVLDLSKLPMSFERFCNLYSEKYKFDYDLNSLLIWPIHDFLSINRLKDSLNKLYPNCASIVRRLVSDTLSYDDLKFSLSND